MAKQSGLGDMMLVAGVDLSGDVGSIGRVSGGPAASSVTGIDVDAFERIGLRRDGGLSWSSWFNPTRAHLTYNDLPTADVMVTYGRGTSLGSPAACCVAKQIGYDGTPREDGSLSFSLEAQANAYGLEWGTQLTAGVRDDTAATNGTGVDLGAAGAHGLQAYLQVTEFTGTDVTIKIQQSSDDAATDAYADVTGGGFTAVTSGPTTERIATAAGQAVEQWLRVVTVTTGGFTSLSFNVVVVVNATAVSF